MLDWCYSKGRGRCRDEWFSRLWTVGTVHFYYDISTLVVTVVGIVNSEMTWAGFWESIELPLGTLLITGMLIKLFLGAIDEWEDESNARNERKKNAKKRGEAYCPWCGSVSIQYYPLGIPYQDYVGSPIQRLNQKYHCNNCGRQW